MWIPAAYQDEVIPPPRNHPSDWIKRLPGDAYALAPIDDDEGGEPHILRDGETISFSWTTDYGDAEFTLGAGDEWSVDREPHPDTTHVMVIFEPDTLGYGKGRSALEAFAKQMIEMHMPAETYSIRYYAWCEDDVPFTFRAGAFIEGASR